MRLLLRSDTHRTAVAADGAPVTEVASCPDTPGRPERWRWHVRLRAGVGAGHGAASGLLTAGIPTTVEVDVDPELVAADVEVVEVGDTYLVERDVHGLLVLVQGSGRTLVEGRFELGERDTLVLEGDDPAAVSLVPVGGGQSQVALVRLRALDRAALGWVP